MIARSVLDLIGRTPMVKINKLVSSEDAELLAKLEWYNPGGSVKDRMALYLVEAAEASGRLRKDKVIIEATSGNTGIALAMIAAVKGYRIVVLMPESVSIERRKIIRAYGADLILSPGEKGTAGAIELKRRIIEEDPEKYVDLDQFSDPANIMAHYQTTAREIIEQTSGKVDMVVVGIGTAGTGVGISMGLKEYKKDVRIVGVTPKLGISIQGLRNPAEENPTKLFRPDAFDEIVEIEDLSSIKLMARELARKEGLLVGQSSAAIMDVAVKKAKEIGRGRTIVAVLPDNGLKYLSTDLFEY
ncbi:MAG: cysteine synthase B [Thermoproteota archaeon]|uniref:Cysteine synthase family protein n=1 Tax=Candidatus Methanodesulfokora washburnensis TaxID=2478471 RepID=A0A520KQ40_9CREN|nr:MAG: cysteine synthase family protein [Candidatus Methanodesulfokores washburnensis]TDA41266.1 MAG: cysteine synthase B [Candidatus Korarchaeota archaeon]